MFLGFQFSISFPPFLLLDCSVCSDDRSPDIFKQRIEAATQMKAVLTVDNKPNCLIIDEIDGAPTVSFFSHSRSKYCRSGYDVIDRVVMCISCDSHVTCHV